MALQPCRLKMPCLTFGVEVSGQLPKGVGVRRHTRLHKYADFHHHMKNWELIQKCGNITVSIPRVEKFSVVLSPTICCNKGWVPKNLYFTSHSLQNSRNISWYTMMPNLGSKFLQASPISVSEFYGVLVPLWIRITGKGSLQAPKRPKIGISCLIFSLSKPLRIYRHRCQWRRRLYGFGCSLCCSQNIPARQADLRFSIFPYCH